MGQVYRARDTQLHRPVAVKLLAPELTSDPVVKQRFLQEARAAARISHPAIAQIYYADEENGSTFLVMELVEGKTVRELIQNRELDLLGAIDVAIQVADGLAKAHELGIVHRDVKPANVMLTTDSHVKILDFGLAKLLDRFSGGGAGDTQRLTEIQMAQTQSGVVMGTAAYMSPEQVRGAAVDERTDIFALGVLLFEMTTWQSPFLRNNFMDTLHAVAYDETPPMPTIRAHIPEELQRIVSRCLRKRAEDRYPNARLLAEELRALRRNTERGVAPRTSWRQRLAESWEQLRLWPSSRYLWIILGLVSLVLALNWSASTIGSGGMLVLLIASLWIYRHIRNRPHRVQELLIRRISKIPEVRLVTIQNRQVTVIVDRQAAQLYSRINNHLRSCNKKLYAGQSWTVSIQEELSAPELRQLLSSPGVEYVREDVMEPSGPGS